jgi:hypothetical protein
MGPDGGASRLELPRKLPRWVEVRRRELELQGSGKVERSLVLWRLLNNSNRLMLLARGSAHGPGGNRAGGPKKTNTPSLEASTSGLL